VYWGGFRPKYEHIDPSEWYKFEQIPTRKDEGCTAEGYRRCCCSLAWIGQALTILLLNGRELWGHDAFFDYCDRWMTEKDDATIQSKLTAACGGVGNASGTMWDNFPKYMWIKYRNTAGSVKDIIPLPEVSPERVVVSPNPVSSGAPCTVSLAGKIKNITGIEIFDARGVTIKDLVSKKGKTGQITWDVTDGQGNPVSNGVYYIFVSTTRQSLVKKIIINK
jgi:hypothetical protein